MSERTNTERLKWLDQPWVTVHKFPHFFWISDRSEAHPEYCRTHSMSPLTLSQAIDAAMDAEQPDGGDAA